MNQFVGKNLGKQATGVCEDSTLSIPIYSIAISIANISDVRVFGIVGVEKRIYLCPEYVQNLFIYVQKGGQ